MAPKPKMTYKSRRRWSLLLLLVGLPIYIGVAVAVLSRLDRPPVWVELLLYAFFGIAWALPFRFVFRGIGQVDPDATQDADRN